MISDKTLLIFGAGASRPYLFPTARELTALILEDGDNTELLLNMGFTAVSFTEGNSTYAARLENAVRQQGTTERGDRR